MARKGIDYSKWDNIQDSDDVRESAVQSLTLGTKKFLPSIHKSHSHCCFLCESFGLPLLIDRHHKHKSRRIFHLSEEVTTVNQPGPSFISF